METDSPSVSVTAVAIRRGHMTLAFYEDLRKILTSTSTGFAFNQPQVASTTRAQQQHRRSSGSRILGRTRQL